MRLSPFARLDAFFAPAPDAARVAFLHARPFAHRGLHGGGIVENSLAAFEAAIAAGHGMECDVRASADGVAFVFHDPMLDRLTTARGPLAARTGEQLDRLRLVGTNEAVPRLAALLARVAGRAPLLIEIKAPDRNIDGLCRAVLHALSGYDGKVAIMSFNPFISAWFRARAPQFVRGLAVSEEGRKGLRGRVERRLSLWRARPDFLACDVRDLPSAFAARARGRGMPVLTWTVRTAADRRLAATHADQSIYESACG